MISDVLSDAVSHIGRWQRDAPEWYGDEPTKTVIDAVVQRMDELRQAFDAYRRDDDPNEAAFQKRIEKLGRDLGVIAEVPAKAASDAPDLRLHETRAAYARTKMAHVSGEDH
jgi:hypothetical protein